MSSMQSDQSPAAAPQQSGPGQTATKASPTAQSQDQPEASAIGQITQPVQQSSDNIQQPPPPPPQQQQQKQKQQKQQQQQSPPSSETVGSNTTTLVAPNSHTLQTPSNIPTFKVTPEPKSKRENVKPSTRVPRVTVTPNNGGTTGTHVSFRRQRATRACETCHSRKVRCDAVTRGTPCTNCQAFEIPCRIPAPKRKNGPSRTKRWSSGSEDEKGTNKVNPPQPDVPTPGFESKPPPHIPSAEIPRVYSNIDKRKNDSGCIMEVAKNKFTRAPIVDAGRVAFLGESSNLTLIIAEEGEDAQAVHYPLPSSTTTRSIALQVSQMSSDDVEILRIRGALLLPSRELSDQLIDVYFKYVHPMVPLINKTRFMASYNGKSDPPSMLLLQSMYLAATRACNDPGLTDASGSKGPLLTTYYKRAKALYDVGFEEDRVTIVQSLILMGWWWEGPEDVANNVFHWTNEALTIAQGSGMHRSVENSKLNKTDKRLWKRIWWSLFARDRSIAVALGRPLRINLDDCDVPMLTQGDFIEEEDGILSTDPVEVENVNFFLQYVKLCEIMGIVLSQQYTPSSTLKGPNRRIEVTTCDMTIADWLNNCPIQYDPRRHRFWPALLFLNYYTILCLLHRVHMPPIGSKISVGEFQYPSTTIASTAADRISEIVENLQRAGQLTQVPGFAVYAIFSAILIHVYQSGSKDPATAAKHRALRDTSMKQLESLTGIWTTARMIHKLFQSIIGNKYMEQKLHASNEFKRQRMSGHGSMSTPMSNLNLNSRFNANGPASTGQSMSHNSVNTGQQPMGPQSTPVISTQQQHQQAQNHWSGTSNNADSAIAEPAGLTGPLPSQHINPQDIFMTGTRPPNQVPAPVMFGANFSAAPKDVFLFTRNSPNPSQFENFQPNKQLFPDGTVQLPTQDTVISPTMTTHNNSGNMPLVTIDPSVITTTAGINDPSIATTQPSAQISSFSDLNIPLVPDTDDFSSSQMSGVASSLPTQSSFMTSRAASSGTGAEQSPTESWGGTSGQGGSVSVSGSGHANGTGGGQQQRFNTGPSTLNVEDWFAFFGFSNEMPGFNFDVPMSG